MKRRLIHLLIILLGLYLIFSTRTYFRAQLPKVKAENEVTQVAKTAGIDRIQKFYLYTKDDTWLTVLGKDKNGYEVYYTYQPQKKETHLGYVSEMVTEENALALTRQQLPDVTVKEARLGYGSDRFIWEVSFIDKQGNLGYHYINAENAVWLETINNL